MEAESTLPLQLFYSYAREDKELRDQLEKHLQPLRIQGWIDSWYDRDIRPGTIWKPEIVRHLKAANIILLLISPDFMRSDFAFNIEVKIAVKRHEEGKYGLFQSFFVLLTGGEHHSDIFQLCPKLANRLQVGTT
jgi:hypothetical protein